MHQSENVIEVHNLTKYYGEFLAVDHIDFAVHRGEIFGFLGPNGAGKTTTIRMLTGILKPSEGEIRIFGQNAVGNMTSLKERIGIVPEMANPYVDITALQNLRLVGKLYGMKKDTIMNRSMELLDLFGLTEKAHKKVRGFSKGLKQRLSLAMALLPDPELLFLDEPTSGLDVMSARLIKGIIREENRKGKTIFMSTHNMSDANELCSRLGIINHGKIVAINTPENIKKIGEEHGVIEVSFDPFSFNADSIEGVERFEVTGDKVKIYTKDNDRAVKSIVEYAQKENLKIVSLNTQRPSLEDVFVYLVGGEK